MIHIQPAPPEQLSELLSLTWMDAEDYLEPALNQMQMTREKFAHVFQTVGQVFAIYAGEQLAGYYWIEKRGIILHLHGLILKPDFQRHGIGTQVLIRIEEQYARTVEAIELGVHKSNTRAISLYEKMGYQIVKVLDDTGFFILQKRLENAIE